MVILKKLGNKKLWAWIAIGLVVIILGSMVAGMVSGPSNRSLPPLNSSEAISQPAPATASADYYGGSAATLAATTAAGASATTAATSNADNIQQSAGSANVAGKAASGAALGAPVAATAVNAPALPADRLVIRNATITLTADDVDKTLLEVRNLAIAQNGLVFQSNTNVRDNKTYANITIQVPAAAFDQTLNQVHKLAGVKVESENSTSQDVTEEYVDVQAQVDNLKATEAQLNKLLDKASDVNQILTVQQQVSNVRGQIDRLQGRLNYLDKRTSMSSLSFTIAPTAAPVPAKTEPVKSWDAGQVLQTAWDGSVRGLQGLYTVVVTLGVWVIWLGPLALLVVVLFRLARRKLNPPSPRDWPTSAD